MKYYKKNNSGFIIVNEAYYYEAHEICRKEKLKSEQKMKFDENGKYIQELPKNIKPIQSKKLKRKQKLGLYAY